MKLYCRLDRAEIISAQNGLLNIYRRKMTVYNVPKRYFPRWCNREKLIGYQNFALAVEDNKIIDIDYLKILSLNIYNEGRDWIFKLVLKEGIFKKETIKINWYEKEEEDKNGKRIKN